MADTVMTVLGPIHPDALGKTLSHEHLQLDLTCLWHQPQDAARAYLVDAPVSADLYAALKQDPYHSLDNLRLDNLAIAGEELSLFRKAGGGTVLDLSTATIGPYPDALAQLSRETGVHIVAGTGYYVRRAHPDWLKDASWEDLAEKMLQDVEAGFPGTGVRAGILGELGTSSPIHPDELKVLKAAVSVQRRHPIAINVHLAIFGFEGLRVLDFLEQEGADLSRVVLSHLDENLDPDYHQALAERGVFLEFDTFGSECRFSEDAVAEPEDGERLAALERLADRHLHQLLLSQDICTKMQWHAFGGKGYDHILTSILPALRDRGFREQDIEMLMEKNPARLLAGGH